MYSNVDLYRNFLPEIKLNELAKLLYKTFNEKEKSKLASNINKIYELPKNTYSVILENFKSNRITYKECIKEISKLMPQNDTAKLLSIFYYLGSKDINIANLNKYIYFMKKYNTDYKYISINKLFLNCGNIMPEYLKDYLKRTGDNIMLPNIINNVVSSITFRSIYGQKEFIKISIDSQLFYNLGNLPDDFKYGVPLLLCEGNIDCDSIKQIYPYSLAVLTNSLSLSQMQLLAYLTNKVILAFDNDEAGNRGYWRTYKSLITNNFRVERFNHSYKLKDFGDLIDLQMWDPDEYNYICSLYKIQIENILQKLN